MEACSIAEELLHLLLILRPTLKPAAVPPKGDRYTRQNEMHSYVTFLLLP